MELKKLQELLRKSWSRETSANPERWSPKNPALDQCAVTALIVQDFFGGKILRIKKQGSKNRDSHFWNLLPDNQEIDLSADQFQESLKPPTGETKVIPRLRLLIIRNLEYRYNLLWSAVDNLIAEEEKNSIYSK